MRHNWNLKDHGKVMGQFIGRPIGMKVVKTGVWREQAGVIESGSQNTEYLQSLL